MKENNSFQWDKINKWSEELEVLHSIICKDQLLTPTVKWGTPVFTYKGKNIIAIAGFKNYLKDLSIIKTKCNYIAKYVNKNDGILAFYINDCLKKAIGKERKKWTDEDLDKGLNILDDLEKQLDYSLENQVDNLKKR